VFKKIFKMKRSILILTVCLLIPVFMSAQSLYKAQKEMDRYNYAEAIEILKKAVDNEKSRNEAIPMLAECYRMQRDIYNTKVTYAQAVTLPDAKPETFYYYAQALESSGDYVKAREMFQKYAEKNPSDTRGKFLVASCDSVLGPWKGKTSEFVAINAGKINTTESEFGPAIYEGDLIFASDFSKNPATSKEYGWTGHGYLKIMKSTPETSGDFSSNLGASAEFDAKFNDEYHDGPATFSADANTIFYTRSYFGKAQREGIYKTNLLKIFYATKTNGVWGEIQPFFLNSKLYSVGHPCLSPDGQTLYFVSDMPGGLGGTDIWLCKREGDGWSKAENLGPVVNTKENEMFPTMRNDGILYFSSEGHAGYGAMDLFETKNTNGTWSVPLNLHPPINGSYDDFAIAFVSGNKSGFFSSNRPGGVGSDDIYTFRLAPPALPAFISGFVKDKITMQPIAGATVFLFNPLTGNVKIIKTGADGMYKTPVNNAAVYTVKAMMPDYIADCTPLEVTSIKPGTTSLAPRDLYLDRLVISKSFSIDNIYYDFDKYNIRADAKPELDKLVTIMNENVITVELSSFTDCRGTAAYNEKLSQRRAESAVKYIVDAGIDKSRITAKGYGESQPTNKCVDGVPCTPAEYQANRRTEFKVISATQTIVNPTQFDPGNYSEGQEINATVLPPDFFKSCK
jgi:outer membrane protein OmpA-like peptidoglycan-associated protein/tetratricopeptide (TPR) repeat protein